MRYIVLTLILVTISFLVASVLLFAWPYLKDFSKNIDNTTSIYNAEQRIKEVERKLEEANRTLEINNDTSYTLTERERQEELIIMLKRLYIILNENSTNLDSLDTLKNIEDLDSISELDLDKINSEFKDTSESNTLNQNTSDNLTVEDELVFPAELLISLSPDVYPIKIDNDWLFSLYFFEDINYSTYQDINNDIIFYIIDNDYESLKKDFSVLDKLYSINETSEYYDNSFFLNPIEKDQRVRLIISFGEKTIWIDVPEDKYDFLKNILLNK